MKKNNFPQSTKRTGLITTEILRRYAEGDLTASESEAIRLELQKSPELQKRFSQVKDYLSILRAFPMKTPPEPVWEAISQKIKTTTPKQVWFPWMYARPAWGYTLKLLPVLGIMLLFLTVGTTHWMEPDYDVIVVTSGNGFGKEAETYLAFHDLSGDPLSIRESLVAFCTDNQSQ